MELCVLDTVRWFHKMLSLIRIRHTTFSWSYLIYSNILLLPLLLLLLLLSANITVLNCHESNQPLLSSDKLHRHSAANKNEPTPTGNGNNFKSGDSGGSVYLESLEDLEHVAYLAMRNFNITDEGLIQTSWQSGGNMLAYNKYQKVVVSSNTDQSSVVVSADQNNKERLSIMLESFILHLRNGHLRRLKLEELREIIAASQISQQSSLLNDNLTSIESSERSGEPPGESAAAAATANNGKSSMSDSEQWTTGELHGSDEVIESSTAAAASTDLDESYERCNHLVSLYIQEIEERQKLATSTSSQQQAATTFAAAAADIITSSMVVTTGEENLPGGGQIPSAISNSTSSGNNPIRLDSSLPNPIDQIRLLKLCRLVVSCHSADDLVGLLNGPWHDNDADVDDILIHDRKRPADKNKSSSIGEDDFVGAAEPSYEDYVHSSSGQYSRNNQPKSLRDSLSQSLAKLCPLMLFQLHDEDGICSFRRDDRPPMITVWGFATLFVTIVSFVSLIGLSITPLLGQSAPNETSTTSSSTSDSNLSTAGLMQMRQTNSASSAAAAANSSVAKGRRSGAARGSNLNQSSSTYPSTYHRHRHQRHHHHHHHQHNHQHPNHQHRACLTLFEGLAVGSLVGSALFSLIPQAFELQERESNQGFLLKALIIFFGIYLFFCSERIMRIILDTRQHRKRKRRGSKNSMALPSTTVDNLVGFHATSSTANCSPSTQPQERQQQQQQQQQRQQHLNNNTTLQGSSGGAAKVFSSKPAHRHLSQSDEIKMNKKTAATATTTTTATATGTNKCVYFPTVKKGNHHQQEVRPGDGDEIRRSSRSKRRERPTQVGSSDNAVAAASGISKLAPTSRRSERRQAAKRHQSRTRRSQTTAAGGRRQKRKTRYQLLVQSKRLHSDSPTLPRDTAQINIGGGGELSPDNQLLPPFGTATAATAATTTTTSTAGGGGGGGGGKTSAVLRKRGSLSSSDGGASYNLDSSIHDSGSLDGDESYDSTTSLDSSTSNSDSDDDITNYRLGLSQRSRQHQQAQLRPISSGMSAATGPAAGAGGGLPRRLASSHIQSGSQLENSHLYTQSATGSQQLIGRKQSIRPIDYNQSRPSSAATIRASEKQEISTVAWMIVLGDGLHNFIDGISIGAAFSESILSGVSISVAVICEEFPHELGDFAVLVSSGMTVRQALGYNFLSACTCYLGMAVGIILGDVNDGASYISALAAGVFLYIALVDMMGELSASLEESSRDSIGKTLKLLLLQNVGIFIGTSIILVLSFIDF